MASALGAGLRWAVPAATAAAGVALRDCLFLSASGPLALVAFYLGMDARPAGDGLRVGVRCALAGLASVGAAVALVVAVVAALHGAWSPEHDRHYAGAWLLAGAAAVCLAFVHDGRPALEDPSRELALVAVPSVIAVSAIAAELPWSLCAAPIATAALMALAGWRLLADAAPSLLSTASRR